MQNDYMSRQGQTQTIDKDKNSNFEKSTFKQEEEKIKDMAGDARKQFEQGKEQISRIIKDVDKQVRKNPWFVLAGAALGFFLLGRLLGASKRH